ncbi:MAG TPA: NAD(P)-dependent oxidoreductase [Solirubrobacterales bacterium]|nr:NAD(P)-dependent oxidoreductase [Solirubrobacterales bacterium]
MSRVAFVGLGLMGRPMAENLLAAGHDVVVANRSPEPVAALEAAGAEGAADAAAAARGADAAITMLPDGPTVHALMTGEEGILAALPEGALAIDMSTIAPAEARLLAAAGAERGIGVLDAPVSGGDVGARAGTLTIMVGGEREDFERALPLFEAMGTSVTHVGPAGAGQVVKACNQVAVALILEGLVEALTLGAAAGVDPETILDVFAGGMVGGRMLEARGPALLSREHEPGFRLEHHLKDLAIALAEAKDRGVELPATPVVKQLMEQLHAEGRGAENHTALIDAVERRAG